MIAVPTIDFAQTVVAAGNCSGAQLDKSDTFDPTTIPHAADAKDTFSFAEIELLAVLKRPVLGESVSSLMTEADVGVLGAATVGNLTRC